MRWALVSAGSWCIAMTIGFTTWSVLYYPLSLNANGTSGLGVTLDYLLCASIIGLIVTVGQGLFLRKSLPSVWKWILFSFVGFLIATMSIKYLRLPFLFSFSSCVKPCEGFLLVPQWLHFLFATNAQEYYILGRSPAAAILGLGLALGQSIAVRQRLAIKIIWLAANAIGLEIAFKVSMLFGRVFLGNEILVVAAILGLTFGLVTAVPLGYLLRAPSINVEENVWLLRLKAYTKSSAVKHQKQLLWIFGNAAVWGVAMTIGFSIWYFFSGGVYINSNLQYEIEFAWGDVIGGLVFGVIIGLGQGMILRKSFAPIWRWMISSSIGLLVCFVLAKYVGQPVLQYSSCSFFCFGFQLPFGWLAVAMHIGATHYALGGPIPGAIVGAGMAFSQIIFLRQLLSKKILWVLASAVSVAIAFTIADIFIHDVLMTGILVGLLYGLATAGLLRPLSRTAASKIAAES